MKKVINVFLAILTFIFTIILSIDIILFTVRKISSNYFSEQYISNIIDNIDIYELLKEKTEEIEEIKMIKEKLKEAGIEEELIDDFIASTPIKEITKDATNQVVDYVIYGKEIQYEVNKDEIYSFLEQNMAIISKELQEKNVPKSEYLTEENQQKILNKLKEEVPIIEENLNEILTQVEDRLQNSEYNEYQNKVNEILDIIRFIYSNEITMLLYTIFIVSIIFIVLTRRSIFKSFKWVGISYMISSIILYIANLFIPSILNELKDLPKFILDIINIFINELTTNLNNYSMGYIMMAIILIVVNIIIYIIKEKLENKKFNQFTE